MDRRDAPSRDDHQGDCLEPGDIEHVQDILGRHRAWPESIQRMRDHHTEAGRAVADAWEANNAKIDRVLALLSRSTAGQPVGKPSVDGARTQQSIQPVGKTEGEG